MEKFWIGVAFGMFAGAILTTTFWFFLAPILEFFRRIAEIREANKPIDFRKMPNPPDEGIDQLVYKPRGEPPRISKGVVGRRSNRNK